MERLFVRGLRFVRPAARHVEGVARLEREVVDGGARVAELGGPALILQRQLEQRLVEPPALAAGDLEDEHVVRVVMHCEALRGGRGQVGIRLNREAEPALQFAAVERDRRPIQM